MSPAEEAVIAAARAIAEGREPTYALEDWRGGSSDWRVCMFCKGRSRHVDHVLHHPHDADCAWVALTEAVWRLDTEPSPA